MKCSVLRIVKEGSRKAKDMVRKNTANTLQKKNQGIEYFLADVLNCKQNKQRNLLFTSYYTQENNETHNSINKKKKSVDFSISLSSL